MSVLFDTLYGNDFIKHQLKTAIDNNKLFHTIIVEGNKGSGKHTLSKLVSVELASDYDYKYKEKIMKGISPDIINIKLKNDRKTIGVDTVREIKDLAYIKPNELEIKIFIIEDAHLLTAQAQNALLKLLEEPPLNVYFIMLCENTANLLITIKSRAVIYKMEVFSDDEVRKYIYDNYKNPVDVELIVKNANGCLGYVAENLSNKKSKKNDIKEDYDNICLLLNNIADKKYAEIILFQYVITDKREELIKFIDLLLLAVRDLLVYKCDAGINACKFFINGIDVENIADKLSSEEVIKIFDKINNFKDKINFNVNIHNFKIMLLMKLSKE